MKITVFQHKSVKSPELLESHVCDASGYHLPVNICLPIDERWRFGSNGWINQITNFARCVPSGLTFRNEATGSQKNGLISLMGGEHGGLRA